VAGERCKRFTKKQRLKRYLVTVPLLMFFILVVIACAMAVVVFKMWAEVYCLRLWGMI